MQIKAMKFHHSSPKPFKDHTTDSSSLAISFKHRPRPLLKTFTSPKCSQLHNQDISQSGGTRWNPTQEQIKYLEGMYAGGMRTPNAEQIERITAELGRHGRIEGKNVFYWFQNHKARERQRQKRIASLLSLRAPPPDPIISLFSTYKDGKEAKECNSVDGMISCKRKYVDSVEDIESDGTLELFPLHPELIRR